MDDANQNANVEAQQTPAETVEQPHQQDQVESQAPARSRYQERIDELTRARHEAERQAQAQAAALAEKDAQVARLLEMVAQRAPAVQAAPTIEVEPEVRQRVEAVVNPQVQALEQRLAQMTAKLEHQEFQTLAAKEDPRVMQQAQKLMADWKRGGYSGWEMKDALIYARGMLGVAETAQVTQSRNERGQFAASAQNVMASQSAPPPPAPTKAGLPADIDRRPLEEQLALYEKHLDGKIF